MSVKRVRASGLGLMTAMSADILPGAGMGHGLLGASTGGVVGVGGSLGAGAGRSLLGAGTGGGVLGAGTGRNVLGAGTGGVVGAGSLPA